MIVQTPALPSAGVVVVVPLLIVAQLIPASIAKQAIVRIHVKDVGEQRVSLTTVSAVGANSYKRLGGSSFFTSKSVHQFW